MLLRMRTANRSIIRARWRKRSRFSKCSVAGARSLQLLIRRALSNRPRISFLRILRPVDDCIAN